MVCITLCYGTYWEEIYTKPYKTPSTRGNYSKWLSFTNVQTLSCYFLAVVCYRCVASASKANESKSRKSETEMKCFASIYKRALHDYHHTQCCQYRLRRWWSRWWSVWNRIQRYHLKCIYTIPYNAPSIRKTFLFIFITIFFVWL